jgi:hypothetical protein
MKVRHRLNALLVCVSVISGVGSLVASVASAQVAEASCSCLVPAPKAGSPVGRLAPMKGDVQMSQAGGYVGVKTEEPVFAGARIMTGSQSSALLSVGADCALDIPANATVKVDPTEGGMCVSLKTPRAKIVPASSGPGLLPILLGGGAVGGAAALILSLHDDDNSVSK